MKKLLLIGLVGVSLVGCGSMSVKPLSLSNLNQGQLICIEDNPKVTVPAFEEYLKEAFGRHNIKTRLFANGTVPDTCEYKLNYVALRSWDMGIYLSKVKLELLNSKDEQVALVDWRQNDFALNKWRNDQGKVYDLVDQLIEKKKK
ncbi:Sbal_3080 family lipoprotein [Acinetobacter sp.]|uniref:Sbal_3080 family lipoprotein n=1 Tax=Acinetobacter sp. TaxID=472 RepID=UPI002649253B|nr:Sbal_3080 family lipoprotein [Acinetobacter sp.]MDN5511167.1 Sbal_3080 family lipoprotein [Acinetobacter sp.]MDN5523940.1 Sbal_3080 family lipoprotein [Acinetobacter sp.]